MAKAKVNRKLENAKAKLSSAVQFLETLEEDIRDASDIFDTAVMEIQYRANDIIEAANSSRAILFFSDVNGDTSVNELAFAIDEASGAANEFLMLQSTIKTAKADIKKLKELVKKLK